MSQQQVKDAIATLPKKYTKYHPKVPIQLYTFAQNNSVLFVFGHISYDICYMLLQRSGEESDEEVYNYNKPDWEGETPDCQALLSKDTDKVELLSIYLKKNFFRELKKVHVY